MNDQRADFMLLVDLLAGLRPGSGWRSSETVELLVSRVKSGCGVGVSCVI